METYMPISSTTLSATATTVTLNSIPATFKDLVVRASVRWASSGYSNLGIRFNSLSTTIYSRTYLRGDGAASFTSRGSNQNVIFGENLLQGTSTTASTFSSVEIYIPSYTATDSKPVNIFGATETNATTSYVVGQANLFRDNGAISSITFVPDSGSFDVGSTFDLYGIV